MDRGKQAKKIAIIGSGYVGGATGKGLSARGHKVVFYDVKPEIIQELNSAGYTARHVDELSRSEEFDIFMLSVQTPTEGNRIRLEYLKRALKQVGEAIGKMKSIPLVVTRSTVPPGTTEKLFVPILEKASGKKVEQGFTIAMQPEFLREVSAEKDFANPWIVVIGSDDALAGRLLGKIYEPFGAPVFYTTLREAEMMKYAHNLLNATKISFFNEMRRVGEKIGADPDAIFPIVVKSAEAMWNPLYGTKNFGPYDGKCLPKDTVAFLTWVREELGLEMPVLRGTIETNEIMKKEKQRAEREKQIDKEYYRRSYDIMPILKRVRELIKKDNQKKQILPND
jgi:UDPglucose 6-dehydrogenase